LCFQLGGAGFFCVMCVCVCVCVLLFEENQVALLQLSSDVCFVFVCWVCGDGFDVVLGKEGSYFLVVFMFVYDDRCFSLLAPLIIAC